MFPKKHRQLLNNFLSYPPELMIPKEKFQFTISHPFFSAEFNPYSIKCENSLFPITISYDNEFNFAYKNEHIKLSTKSNLPLSLYIGTKNNKIKFGPDSLGLSSKLNIGTAKTFYNCKIINGIISFSQIKEYQNLAYGFLYYDKYLSSILQYKTNILNFGLAITVNDFIPQAPLFLSVEAKNKFSKIQLMSGLSENGSEFESHVVVSFNNNQYLLTGLFEMMSFPIIVFQKKNEWGNIGATIGEKISLTQITYMNDKFELKAYLGYNIKKYVCGFGVKILGEEGDVRKLFCKLCKPKIEEQK